MVYPINIKIKDMNIVIVGGGEVAYRKCNNFLNFNANITVVSLEFIDKFHRLNLDMVRLIEDEYKEKYLKEAFIVVAATDNKEINEKIGIYCRNNGKLVNVVDNIEISNFTVPSYVKRGDLLISISTGGSSPSLSARIRRDLEKKYNEDYDEYTRILGNIRTEVIKKYENKVDRKNILNQLANLTLEELKIESKKYL